MSATPERLAVATYNVHRCVGRDGRSDPDRIADVIAELGSDVVGLQEIDCHVHAPDGFDQLAHLVARSGPLHFVAGPTCRRERVTTGNAILSRFPIVAQRWVDLSIPAREPRGALDVDLDVNGRALRVVNTHLGLRFAEREEQVDRLLAALAQGPEGPAVLLGDLNEWYPRGKSLRRLATAFSGARAAPTFPAAWPLLPLDRVFTRPRAAFVSVEALASPLARVASDHLPLRATLDLRGAFAL